MAKRRVELPPRNGNGAAAGRRCDHPNCTAEGLYRAPRSPDELRRYYWFCLEHVRAYNAAWDFFADMTEAEIDAFRRNDMTGHKPTWPVGLGGHFRRLWSSPELADLFGLLGRDEGPAPSEPVAPLSAAERDALAVLNLSAAATVEEIKERFKELAKRYHPDLNQGNKSSEERFKLVIEAYRRLLDRRVG